VEQHHHCVGSFTTALKKFINQLSSKPLTARQLQNNQLPITHIDVYHCFKLLPSVLNGDKVEKEIIRAIPARKGTLASRFDTVVVLDNSRRDEAESTGLQGNVTSS
jgi:hypothetical protein